MFDRLLFSICPVIIIRIMAADYNIIRFHKIYFKLPQTFFLFYNHNE